MTAELPARVLTDPTLAERVRPTRAVRFVMGVLRQTLVDPIVAGRLRDQGWPYGLRAIVVAGYVAFAIAGLTVIFSGLIRSADELTISGFESLGLPRTAVIGLVVLLSFGVSAFMNAALHGPWWLRIFGLLFGLAIVGIWSLRDPTTVGGPSMLVVAMVLLAALVIFVVVRWRGRFAWWEFAVIWLLVGAGMLIGVLQARTIRRFGFDLTAQLLQQTALLLGSLALPAALIAGASVAEITVRATVAATRSATRLGRRRGAVIILLAVLAVRAAQFVREWLGRDPVSQGLIAYVPAMVIVLGFTALGVAATRAGHRRGAAPAVSELSDELGRVGFLIALAMTVTLLPVQIVISIVQIVGTLDLGGEVAGWAFNPTPISSEIVDPYRVALGVVLLVLASRAARRGATGRALVLGCIGIMLIALARNLVLRDATAAPIDPDVLNSVATAAVLLAILITALRRRMTTERALAFAGILILSALFSYRDFISDPLGVLLGFSGAALVLFGLTWDLLTGAGWGNGDSARFPRPTRVLLVLTNFVLTMTVLGYAALIRDGSTTIYLDPYAQLGDLIFGTALLAATVIAVFDAAWRNATL